MTTTTSDLLHPTWDADCDNNGTDLIHRGAEEVFTPSEGDGVVVLTLVRCDELHDSGQVVYPHELHLSTSGVGPVCLTAEDVEALGQKMREMQGRP